MTYNTLTEEYEVFRLLKCSSELHQFYTSVNTAIRQVGNKDWPHRIKFPEQLLDCVGKTIYLVEVMELSLGHSRYAYEDVEIHLYVVNDLCVFKGKSGILDAAKREVASFEELASIATNDGGSDYFISAQTYSSIFQLRFLNLAPSDAPWCGTYDAVFYNRETAEAYTKELKEFKRQKTL